MARISVTHTIGGLARDCERITTTTQAKMVKVVKRNVEQGNRAARRLARESSGPHGAHYFKRITGEMTGPLSGEWGLDATGPPVGGGWRNGPPNTDIPRSADIQGPKFAKDVGDVLDGLFW